MLGLIQASSEQRNCVVCYTAGVSVTEIFTPQHKRKWPQACQQDKVKGIRLKTNISILTYLEPHQLRKAVTELTENKPKQQRKRKYEIVSSFMVYYLVLCNNYNIAFIFFLQMASYLQKIIPSTELKQDNTSLPANKHLNLFSSFPKTLCPYC